jgi:hypothetical protein
MGGMLHGRARSADGWCGREVGRQRCGQVALRVAHVAPCAGELGQRVQVLARTTLGVGGGGKTMMAGKGMVRQEVAPWPR